MAQAYHRQAPNHAGNREIPLVPVPEEGANNQWPTFSLNAAQLSAISNHPAGWLLTVALPPLTSDEVVLPGGASPTFALTAGSRTIGPQAAPAGANRSQGAPGSPGQPAPASGRMSPRGGRVAPAQVAPPSGVAKPMGQAFPTAANPPPAWTPMPTARGNVAPPALDAVGQAVAWASLTLAGMAVVFCWLALLAAPLGLIPAVLAVAGVVTGHIAQARTLRATLEHRLAVVGTCLGYLGALATVGCLLFTVFHGGA